MTNKDLPRIINRLKGKTLKQLESATSWSLVFADEETNSIISISRGDHEQIMLGLMVAENFDLNTEPYLISGFKFYTIEWHAPF
jgi:RNase P/RNase MRP subunit POP5